MPKPIPPISGIKAREWRRDLAAGAERHDDSIRTLKYPLEDAKVDWPEVKTLQQITSGDGEGSLVSFLYSLLLNGFRVFGKQAATESFRNGAILDDESWEREVSCRSPLSVAQGSFIPSAIYQRLLISPRAVGGKDSGFRPDVVAVEYAKYFCGGKHSDNIPEAEQVLFKAIGQRLCDKFESWKAITNSPVDAAGEIDATLKDLSYPLPSSSLKQRLGAIRPCEPAGTIAYDPAAAPIEATQDTRLNLIVARALADGRNAGLSEKKDLVKYAQEYVTGDANHGGLAWLFGRGLVDYFQVVGAEQCASDFGVSAGHEQIITEILESAKAIPPASTTMLGGKNYAAYRMGIGGTLTSWVANYISRLYDLAAVLEADVEALTLPSELLEDERLFFATGFVPREIEQMCQQAMGHRPQAKDALWNLLGRNEKGAASPKDIEVVETYNAALDTLAGALAAIKEQTKKAIAIADATRDAEALRHLKTYEFSIPKWISPLDKLNRINLSPRDPATVLLQTSNEFDVLHGAMHEHYAKIRAWAEATGETLSPLLRLTTREENASRGGTSKSRNATEYAFRACLDMVGRSARKCGESTLRKVVDFFAQNDVFADRSHLNQYFFNRRGSIYKSPYDKSPRQPFPISKSAFDQREGILGQYADFLAQLRQEVMSADTLNRQEVSDLYRLERGHFAMLMTGFPEEVPSDLALLDSVRDVFNLPMAITLRLGGETVSSSVMRRIFNHYYLQLERMAAILLRNSFFVRAKFQRVGDNALLYAPSGEKLWNVPTRLYETAKPIGTALRRLEAALGSRAPIDTPQAVAYLAGSTENVNDPSIRAFFRQAPHDWYFPWPGGVQKQGLTFDKDVGFGKRLTKTNGCRLVGSPSYKGVLDLAISDPNLVSVGDICILVDQYFDQITTRRQDGKLEVQVIPRHAVVNLALPVTVAKAQKRHFSFSRYVAIDLGERGLGYAVFDTQTHALIEKGLVKVRSMHRLVMDDRIGKKKRLEACKFSAAYDPAEERRRENVVGDYCNAINRLMWYYDAFPVLEYGPGGASNAVDRVYQSITERYLFSTTPTVDAARRNYWTGASYWKHGTLLQYKFDKTTGKKGKTTDALSLFPGTGVSSYGTSQECSCCRRNPVEAVRAAGAEGNKTFQIEPGGRVLLGNDTILLKVAVPEAERGQYRAKNLRTPLAKPVEAGLVSGDDLMRLIRRNLRQAPASRQSKDTDQARYQCLYEDCGKSIHAEENASINIGRKFASERP